MLDFVNGLLKKFFGSKSDRDLKDLSPFVPQILDAYNKLSALSNDQLRSRTFEFRERIQNHISEIENELNELTNRAETDLEMDLQEKEEIFTRVDQLKKDRNQKIEEVLLEILPEAFAVVKETARRYKENEELEVSVSDHDREVAIKRNSVVIRGDKA